MSIHSGELQRLLSAATVATEWVAKVPTATEPTGDGVIQWRRKGQKEAADKLELLFVGSNAANETFSVRVYKWSRDADGLWWPQMQVELAATLGDVDASAYGTDMFMADTVANTIGDATVALTSPANDVPAAAILEPQAAEKVEIIFNLGTAASANVLYRRLETDY
ncbi:MAG: hypothetical protein H8E44_01320 [Planctomycetes bacterium]|nr:hypothetical protein [Planctomycetota bacterium]